MSLHIVHYHAQVVYDKETNECDDNCAQLMSLFCRGNYPREHHQTGADDIEHNLVDEVLLVNVGVDPWRFAAHDGHHEQARQQQESRTEEG